MSGVLASENLVFENCQNQIVFIARSNMNFAHIKNEVFNYLHKFPPIANQPCQSPSMAQSV